MRKYTNIRVSRDVRVMSDGHFWFRVYMDGGPTRDYALDIGFDGLPPYPGTWDGAPKYLAEEVDRQIGEMFSDGTATFYEHDQLGYVRRDKLRYLDMDTVAWWAAKLTEATR